MWSLRCAQINLVFEHFLIWEKKTNFQTLGVESMQMFAQTTTALVVSTCIQF